MTQVIRMILSGICLWVLVLFAGPAGADDLSDIVARGVIRHLGVPYANFVTGSGDGLDVELVRQFADHIGVRYEYVPATWPTLIQDLTGSQVTVAGTEVQVTGKAPVRGDIIAGGLTVIDWRRELVDFSDPVFPTQVWLMARADSSVKPIVPAGDIESDINLVKSRMAGLTVLGMAGTCLDPKLYDIRATGAHAVLFSGDLNELAPAVINLEADATLLDVPDALIALHKWPGQVKIIGPVSRPQTMAAAFSREAPQLRAAFNRFLEICRSDGRYLTLVTRYYPDVIDYYPAFFKTESQP